MLYAKAILSNDYLLLVLDEKQILLVNAIEVTINVTNLTFSSLMRLREYLKSREESRLPFGSV